MYFIRPREDVKELASKKAVTKALEESLLALEKKIEELELKVSVLEKNKEVKQ